MSVEEKQKNRPKGEILQTSDRICDPKVSSTLRAKAAPA
jgi:hypothetical protein